MTWWTWDNVRGPRGHLGLFGRDIAVLDAAISRAAGRRAMVVARIGGRLVRII